MNVNWLIRGWLVVFKKCLVPLLLTFAPLFLFLSTSSSTNPSIISVTQNHHQEEEEKEKTKKKGTRKHYSFSRGSTAIRILAIFSPSHPISLKIDIGLLALSDDFLAKTKTIYRPGGLHWVCALFPQPAWEYVYFVHIYYIPVHGRIIMHA